MPAHESVMEEIRAPAGALFLAWKGIDKDEVRCFPEFPARLAQAIGPLGGPVTAARPSEEITQDGHQQLRLCRLVGVTRS